jgi:putative spermidine/putrescine transport system permease protein
MAAAGTRRPTNRLALGALLTPPLLWLVVAYLGSLVVLFAAAFWHFDALITFQVQKTWSLENFRALWDQDVYRTVTIRTVGIAAAVTALDAVLAFPLAWFMAKYAGLRTRSVLAVAILMPLWSSYLVKVLAWRLLLSDSGVLAGILEPFGLHGPGFSNTGVWLVMSYIWLPYMILPLYIGFERLPDTLLEASGDLGARNWTTFRHVVLPLVFPSLVAGSIFTFSLTLGDYIAVAQIGSGNQFIGSLIYTDFGTNVPLAAAYAMVPVAIMIVYLLVARRLGAFNSL